MSIGGTWDIILNTPMGKQKGKMAATVNGTELAGEINSPMGIIVMEEGAVDGDAATWICTVTKPITMQLVFNVNVEGDAFKGTVKVGPLGTNSVEGKRI
jgi:hypothetical protein